MGYGFNSKVFYVVTNEYQTILEDKKLFHTLTFRFESHSWNKETVFIQLSVDNSRLTLCLLAVIGLRINELLNIKVFQLKTLTQESWIVIDRSKRGPSNHKAFLTKEGKKII